MRALIFFILFTSFAHGQVVVDWYRHSSCGTGFYLDNAVTPGACEQNDMDGWEELFETGSITTSSDSGDFQEGAYSIKIACTTDITSNAGARLAFTGLTVGVTYLVTYYIKRSGTVNIITDLNSGQGWTATDTNTTGTSADSWFQETLQAQANATTAYFRIFGQTSFDTGEIIYVDNLTIVAL